MNKQSSDTEVDTSDDNISSDGNSDIYKCPNEEISEALKSDHNNIDIYFSEGKISSEEISLKINDIGKITFPITQECAKQMISVASLAAFGQNEETKIDQNVRDTYMISKDKIEISINNLDNILSTIQKELLLNENSGLSASLHNLLIYGKGQFFKYHQDTEKLDNMVGTLVVSLPSAHIGGDLVIRHLTKLHTFSTETVTADHAKYIAFYSDCHHKIKMIKDGYRVVVTYNVVLNQPNFSPVLSCNENLLNLINKYFFESKRSEKVEYFDYNTADNIPKLVYLLDHSYSKKEFTVTKLKGSDVCTVSSLLAVAIKLNLVVHLALAVIDETWDDMNGELDNLESFRATMDSWRDEHGNLVPFNSLSVDLKEVCWLRNNDKFKAIDIEKQYTGNEGVTEDRQYRRATIVLWPKSCNNKMIFHLNYDMGMNKIKELMRTSDNREIVCEMTIEACKFKINQTNKSYTEVYVEAAIYIQNPEKALEIAFYICNNIFDLDSEISSLFLNLKNAYGSSWNVQLLNATAFKSFSEVFITKFIPCFNKSGEQQPVNKLLKDQAEIIKAQDTKYSYIEKSILRKYGCIIKTAYDANCTDAINYVLETIISQNWDTLNLISFYIDYCKHMDETITISFKETIVKLLNDSQKFSEDNITMFIPCFNISREQELVNKLLKNQTEIINNGQKVQSHNEKSILHNYGCIIKTAYNANCTDIINYVVKTIISQNWQKCQNLASFYIDYSKYMDETINSSFKNTVVKYLQDNIIILKTIVSNKSNLDIRYNKNCSCELCSRMVNFLSSGKKCTRFKIKQADRKHLFRQFQNRSGHYSMTVEEKGSPYTLIIEKSDDIHTLITSRLTLAELEELLRNVLSTPEPFKASAPLVAELTTTAPDVSRKRSAEAAVEATAAKKSFLS